MQIALTCLSLLLSASAIADFNHFIPSVSAGQTFTYSLSTVGPGHAPPVSSDIVKIIATLTSGTAEPVTLSCSGTMPSGIRCDSFSPATITPTSTGTSSDLLVTVDVLPFGSYSFAVTGSQGQVATTVTMNVIPPPYTTSTVIASCYPSGLRVGGFASCRADVTGYLLPPPDNVTFSSNSPTGKFTPPNGKCTLLAVFSGSLSCAVMYTDTASSNTAVTITASFPGDQYNSGSTGTASLTVATASNTLALATSSVAFSSGAASADQTSTTGISVQITSSREYDGFPVGITTQDLSSLSAGVGTVSLTGAKYYDVAISNPVDGTAKVCISYTPASSTTTMQYWTGTVWADATGVMVSGTLVCGQIPVGSLSGTNIALGTPTQATPQQAMVLGLTPTVFYEMVGGVAAVIVVGSAVIGMSRRGNTKPAI